MINRRGIFGFIAAALGIGDGKAQEATPLACFEQKLHECSTPQNNECPVCGTITEPLKALMISTVTSCPDLDTFPHPNNLVCVHETRAADQPPRIVRCKRCNVAFWQDPE